MTQQKRLAEAEARYRFQRYVQRVAFQLTLSAPMIAALKYVRDDPGFSAETLSNRYEKGSDYDNIRALNTGASLFITEVKALERRGLTYHDEPLDKDGKTKWITGHRYTKLTRIGELTCEMLVEAGMMSPQAMPEKQRKRKAA